MLSVPDLFPPVYCWEIMATFNVVFDESGKAASSHVIYAGFFATENTWQQFNREWLGRLRRYGISYFRASEAFTFGREWSQFRGDDPAKEAERDDLIRSLARLAAAFPKESIGTVINTAEFKALPFAKRERYKDNPLYCVRKGYPYRGQSQRCRSRG